MLTLQGSFLNANLRGSFLHANPAGQFPYMLALWGSLKHDSKKVYSGSYKSPWGNLVNSGGATFFTQKYDGRAKVRQGGRGLCIVE